MKPRTNIPNPIQFFIDPGVLQALFIGDDFVDALAVTRNDFALEIIGGPGADDLRGSRFDDSSSTPSVNRPSERSLSCSPYTTRSIM